jgi:hypothetical protein
VNFVMTPQVNAELKREGVACQTVASVNGIRVGGIGRDCVSPSWVRKVLCQQFLPRRASLGLWAGESVWQRNHSIIHSISNDYSILNDFKIYSE